jgi:hypothetical protein
VCSNLKRKKKSISSLYLDLPWGGAFHTTQNMSKRPRRMADWKPLYLNHMQISAGKREGQEGKRDAE